MIVICTKIQHLDCSTNFPISKRGSAIYRDFSHLLIRLQTKNTKSTIFIVVIQSYVIQSYR